MAEPSKKKFRWRWAATSLLITTSLAFPLSYLAIPPLARWYMLSKLTDPDLAQRERGLNFLIQRAPKNPSLVSGAIRRLAQADDENFLQIAGALDHVSLWQRPSIPDGLWLRWLAMIASDKSAAVRVLAAQRLAEAADLAADPRMISMSNALLQDPDAEVRYNTLVAAVQLGRRSDGPDTPYRPLLARAASDPDSTIARHAWIFWGLFGWPDPPQVNTLALPEDVAQAFVWAWGRGNRHDPTAAIQLCYDAGAPSPLREMAVYALHSSPHEAAVTALKQHALVGQGFPATMTSLMHWRALLALPDSAWEQAAREAPLLRGDALALRSGSEPNSPSPTLDHARVYRAIRWTTNRDRALAHRPYDPLLYLAALEGLPPGQAPLQPEQAMPDLLRLATVAATADPHPQDLRPLFASPHSPLRDLACVVAVDRFSSEQNATLVESLLRDFNDDAKRSGAVLAGLTGLHPTLLASKADAEDIWTVQQILKLGLWMQGHRPDLDKLPETILTRDDLPTSSILLAMLHRGHPAAMEYLFNPTGEEIVDLEELLDQDRWWWVLQRYLPTDAPPLWLWADPQLKRFQLEVLRDWCLWHRNPTQSRN